LALCTICGATNVGVGGVPLVQLDDKFFCRRCLVKTKGIVRCSVCGTTAGATNDAFTSTPDGKFMCASCGSKHASGAGARQAAATMAPAAPVAAGNSFNLPVDKLIGGLQLAYAEAVQPTDKVLFILAASSGEALVATDKRAIVLKAGFASGSTNGHKHRAFSYDSIMKVEVKAGIVQGVLQIHAPGVKPISAAASDAYQAENVVTFIGDDYRDRFERAGKALTQMAADSHR
jgi:hypothetical protein